MPPALTKILKNGHGIHLSSPPAAVRTDSEGKAMCSIELQPHMRPIEDDDDNLQQKMWNLSSFHSLDSCLLDTPASPLLSPCLQTSDSQCETMSLSSPNSLVNLLFFNKGSRDSHQVASVFPDVPDMFLAPGPEHNRQQACLLHGRSVAPECGPDGGDVHHSSLNLISVFPSYPQWEFTSQGHKHVFAPPPSLTWERAVGTGCPPPASAQPCIDRVNPDQLTSKAVLEEAAKAQLSRQIGLRSQAWRLRKRLETLLGEHAVRHCNQQLEGLAKHCQLGDLSFDCHDSSQESNKPHFPWLDSPIASSSFSEVEEFSHFSQVVLRGLQEGLDSEATASSSSDEEPEEEKIQNRISSISRSSCERQWLEDRAEISSRWSWLELRLAALEGNIQQLVDLSKRIRSTKSGVVLADSQPLTDRQIQQTLLKEMAGLSYSDPDNEPYSPTRLLHNIERQSAQLSQIVNSLISPLSFSPLSKQPQTWKDKGTLPSGQRGDNVFVPASSKKRRLGTRRLFKADLSCVCARTRPLVTYQKPRLFTFNSHSPGSPLDSGKSMTTLSSLLSSSCSSCSSCDPVASCSDPDCSSSRVLSSDTLNFQAHPVSSLTFGMPTYHHMKRILAREVWSQRPLVINSPANYKQHSSTPLHNSHKYKQHTRHHKSRVMGLSPIRLSVSTRGQHSKASQRKKKRRRIHRLLEEEEDVLYQLCDPEESSDDVLEESYTHASHKQVPRGFVRRRQGESVYNINNIVIPMPLAKVEKLQYKEILIPSWRVVDTQPLMEEPEKEGGQETGQAENLSDEVFAQRHLALERKEKSRWSSWDKRKHCRHPTRSGSRLLGSRGGMYTSGEESSVEWSCTQLDLDDSLRSEEWLPQTPWEPRVFPLDEVEEVALLSEKEVPLGFTAISSPSSTSKNSSSCPAPPQSSYATLPSVGHSKNSS
ncbi:KAT8 regulatory NSL complex subunit 1-like protein isoform X1 [Archocentrus centrarchus]|uniref:KAT8 regulatory NSL complex subunit 1-like protein isoform X1 n=1 Tax=Archocentrus centrarchus TaxID=63155 RepID=UPI0011E9C255|nr:KAT8 regulatory NSL complex subunit 1-like protein isoform X1 [Archocentrus centrarchus]